jgi:hypothetical protein
VGGDDAEFDVGFERKFHGHGRSKNEEAGGGKREVWDVGGGGRS